MSNLFDLNGKVALVTGASGLLGGYIVKGFLNAGAKVYASSRDLNNLHKRFEYQERDNSSLQLIAFDQTSERETLKALEEINNSNESIDILVNSAVVRPMKKFFNDSLDSWQESVNHNSTGLFNICRCVSKYMLNDKYPSIINISSIYGVQAPDFNIYDGSDFETEPDYPFIKAGMIGFSRYLASYLSTKNIRVNSVSPGGFFNNQSEPFLSKYLEKLLFKRMATDTDIQGITIFLASDASRYITGQNFIVDGGFTIK